MPDSSTLDLVGRALDLLPANHREAARTLGVAEGTIRRWRRGSIGSLRSDTRMALLRFLDRAEGGSDRAVARRSAAAKPEDDELRLRLDAIEAQDLDPAMKIWKIREIAASLVSSVWIGRQ